MTKNQIITRITERVKELMPKEAAHDWSHIERVLATARTIGQDEGANIFVVELAALLHDVGDWKFHNGDETVGPRMAREIMSAFAIDEAVIEHVIQILSTMSFKGAGVATPMRTLEGKCVQDADRLDAIGAVGIARAFAYGGHKGSSLWNPNETTQEHTDKHAYHKSTTSVLGHFDEKLLHLSKLMTTRRGYMMAGARDAFMREFVTRFKSEWFGKL